MKLDFPATQRNKNYISEVLASYLPQTGKVLEVASGSGQHICHFAKEFSHLTWIPSDPDPDHLKSVDAWVREDNIANVEECLLLDARERWDLEIVDMLICINMTHISPFEATSGLFKNAQKVLKPGGYLYLYGPYFISEIETAPSNLAFDKSLKSRNQDWGIRDLEDIKKVGVDSQFKYLKYIQMPANNYSVIFQSQ